MLAAHGALEAFLEEGTRRGGSQPWAWTGMRRGHPPPRPVAPPPAPQGPLCEIVFLASGSRGKDVTGAPPGGGAGGCVATYLPSP